MSTEATALDGAEEQDPVTTEAVEQDQAQQEPQQGNPDGDDTAETGDDPAAELGADPSALGEADD